MNRCAGPGPRVESGAMFTGIVRERGRVAAAAPRAGGLRLTVRAALAGKLAPGDSLAVNGACLTAVRVGRGAVAFDVVAETLARTALGALKAGDRVNLEPPLSAGEPLGGHFVQGHIDGTGTVIGLKAGVLRVRVEPCLARQMIPKGSIALDGVSLTLVDVTDDAFSTALIPFTLANTTLGKRAKGERVNIELDMLGKYVAKLVGRNQDSGVDMALLKRAGFAEKEVDRSK